jgi:hypothetical protein
MGMKRIRLLSLLFVAALFVQNAAATILPYSSHYQGRSYFNFSGVTGHVDFAVYDTSGSSGDEWAGAGFTAPGDGQYIYAYQIFNDVGSAAAIEFFSIMGVDNHVLDGIFTMNTQNPWENYPLITEGVAPTNSFPNTNLEETRATWEFAGGILIADEYSWFLVFSSTHNWTVGRYDINPLNNDATGPVPNPEPCTLALLGLGSAIFLAKRKNSVVKMAYAIKSYEVH